MKTNQKNVNKEKTTAIILFLIACCLYGMYYDFCGAVLTAILGIFAIIRTFHKKKIQIQLSYGFVMAGIFVLGYGLSVFWAVDSGMAVGGIFRVLWIVLFLLLFGMEDHTDSKHILDAIPYIGIGMVLISVVGYKISAIGEHVIVNNRIGGLFQYPNTFAIFLLLGMIVLMTKEKIGRKEMILCVFLAMGIGLTGSRIGMVLFIVTVVIISIIYKRPLFLAMIALVVVAAVIFICVLGNYDTIGRLFQISISESTLVGRLLYAKDALPLLLTHPFGMGHMGYYYASTAVQTGMYSVQYVHNDLLQIGLDIGWIPMLAYLGAVIGTFRAKTVERSHKIMLGVIFVHGLLDFDLSFTVILFIAFWIMNEAKFQSKKDYFLSNKVLAALAIIFMCAGINIAISQIAEYNGNMELALQFYPWNTQAELKLISDTEDAEQLEQYCDDVLERNETCSLAYYGKAMTSYIEDDYEKMITYQKKAIEKDYFNKEQYRNYGNMLLEGILSDTVTETVREKCIQEYLKIPDMLSEAKEKLSSLGKKIKDQPDLELDQEMIEVIQILNDSVNENQ